MSRECIALAHEIAASAAASDIESFLVAEIHSGQHNGWWYDLTSTSTTIDDRAFIDRSVRYLELRKLLQRHPEYPNLIRPKHP